MKCYSSLSEMPISNYYLGIAIRGNLAFLRKDIDFYDIKENTEIPENAGEIWHQMFSEIPEIDLNANINEFLKEYYHFKFLVTGDVNLKNKFKKYSKLVEIDKQKPVGILKESEFFKTVTQIETHFKFQINIHKTPVIKFLATIV